MHDIRVAIAGLGAIGRTLARKLRDGMPGLTLACAAAGDRAKAQAFLDRERIACPLVALDEFPAHADIAVECAPAAQLENICRPMLDRRQIGDRAELRRAAAAPGPGRTGQGAWRHASSCRPARCSGSMRSPPPPKARSRSVRMITRKPPGGLKGAPYLEKNGISVDGLNEAKRSFPAARARRRPAFRPM